MAKAIIMAAPPATNCEEPVAKVMAPLSLVLALALALVEADWVEEDDLPVADAVDPEAVPVAEAEEPVAEESMAEAVAVTVMGTFGISVLLAPLVVETSPSMLKVTPQDSQVVPE